MKQLVYILLLMIFAGNICHAENKQAKNEKQINNKNKVWIFVGLPGDKKHYQNLFVKTDKLICAFSQQYGIARKNITVLFGKESNNLYPVCNRENLYKEFANINKASNEGYTTWVIFAGHSTPGKTKQAVNFNILGKDISAKEIKDKLKKGKENAKQIIFITTALSGKYPPILAKKERIIICAEGEEAEQNEPEYINVLPDVLLLPHVTDINHDGMVSLFEIYETTRKKIKELYKNTGMFQKEFSEIDGNGDGITSKRRFFKDIDPAKEIKLKIVNKK